MENLTQTFLRWLGGRLSFGVLVCWPPSAISFCFSGVFARRTEKKLEKNIYPTIFWWRQGIERKKYIPKKSLEYFWVFLELFADVQTITFTLLSLCDSRTSFTSLAWLFIVELLFCDFETFFRSNRSIHMRYSSCYSMSSRLCRFNHHKID